MQIEGSGGEGGIRTLDTGVSPYNGLANRRLQPLGHLSGSWFSTAYHIRLLEFRWLPTLQTWAMPEPVGIIPIVNPPPRARPFVTSSRMRPQLVFAKGV